MARVEFWFEFASTYSYPAAWRIEAQAAAAGVKVEWCPFLLGPIFAEQGWGDSPFNLYPEKGRYMWRDLERTCADLELPFRRPSQFPRNGLLAARVACAAAGAPWLGEYVRRVFQANFAEDRDISDPQVVREVLSSLDLSADLLELAKDPAVKTDLRERTERARQLAIFGAPSFRAGNELFWGNDRLAQALEWALGETDGLA